MEIDKITKQIGFLPFEKNFCTFVRLQFRVVYPGSNLFHPGYRAGKIPGPRLKKTGAGPIMKQVRIHNTVQ
jgi:hypothetical protein